MNLLVFPTRTPIPETFHGARLFRTLRVGDWWYLLGIPMLAAVQARPAPSTGRVFVALLYASAYLCWGYVFNNLFDQDEDNSRKNPFRKMRKGAQIGLTGALQLLLFGLAVFTDTVLQTLLIMLLNAAYSAPPVRLKRFLFPSLLLNGTFFATLFWTSARILRGGAAPSTLPVSVFVFLLFLPIQYVHSLEHREEAAETSSPAVRFATILFFLPLCVFAGLSPEPALRGFLLPSCLYAAVSSALVVTLRSGSRARRALRLASMGFGAYLAFALYRA